MPIRDTVMRTLAFCGVVFLLFSVSALRAAEPPQFSPEALEFFEKNIRPVLADRCYECHSASSQKIRGAFLLDSREGLLKGGETGTPAIVPGQPEQSLLIKAIRYTDKYLQMPPKERLTREQVSDFEKWIQLGAPDPRTRTEPVLIPSDEINFEAAKKFWSFQPISKPALPEVKNPSWPGSPIDHFILAKLEEKGLAPAPPTDKRTLIRRATFDLIGLPPAPEEIEAFLADDSPGAFEKVIDRLLASPHYGERWGRHWLDLVRYADTSGCNSDFPIPSAYKYRDYVIDSFNRDKPYDQFVREQIAGDLMPAETEEERYERIIATGYLATSRRFGSRNNENHLTLEDTIDNLGKAVLGLSVSCARCHDHKYDPVSMRDYYGLYGILKSTWFAFPGTEIYRNPKDFVPLAPAAEAEALRKYQAELAELDDRIERLQVERRALDRVEQARAEKGEPAPSPAPDARTLLHVKAELEDARTRQRQLENRPVTVEKAYAVSEGTPAHARLHKKGDPRAEGDEVPRGFLEILGGQQLPAEANGSGRKELAGWLTGSENPLTARVMVNRIWQHHFGRGIVSTPNDFGTRGQAPSHPELLDYLAVRFIESGWSMKAMHKLMMLSQTYRMSSAENPAFAEADPENKFFWKFHRQRLSAEQIRDAILAISGSLDRTMGGPHPFPPEKEWRYTQHRPFIAVYETDQRSVYLMQQRIKKHPFLEIFDGADPNAITGERPLSTTAIQALYMMNAPLVHAQSDKFAVRVGLASRDDHARIDYAHRLAFGRPATREEIDIALSYLQDAEEKMRRAGIPSDQLFRAALASYTRVLFSSNEFLFVD
jgi:hypothetical protein